MQDDALRQELDCLRERVERLELALRLAGHPLPDRPSSPEPTAPPLATHLRTLRDAHRSDPAAATLTSSASPSDAASAPSVVSDATPAHSTPFSPPTAPPTAVPPPVTSSPPTAPRPVPRPAKPPISLEQLIGGKWMAWLGALVVVIGAGLLAKLAYDAGLWGALDPAIRCLLLAAFGGAMLVGGEVVYRRIGRPAAIGLYAAGLGVLYVTAFATFGWYNLLPEIGAFGLLALVAAGGFALTLRTRSLTIGVLSALGGYLAPVLLRGASTFDLAQPLYLTALFGIGLGLSAFLPRPFRVMRGVSMTLQFILGLLWALSADFPYALILIFGGLWWGMTLVEAVYAAARRQSPLSNALTTLIATAVYVTAACLAMNTDPAAASWKGLFTLCVAAIAAVAGLQFGSGAELLRTLPKTALDRLAVALWVQATVLIPIAAALQLDGPALTVAWLAIGLAGIEIGRRVESRGATFFGLAVGALAVCRVALIDWWAQPGFTRTLVSVAACEITPWSLLALGTVATLLLAAFRVRARPSAFERALPAMLLIAALVGWLITTAAQCTDAAATSAWLLSAAALIALRRFGVAQRFAPIGLAALGVTAIKWVIWDTLAGRAMPRWSPDDMAIFLNADFGLGLAIATAAVWVWWTLRAGQGRVSFAVSHSERGDMTHAAPMVAASVLPTGWRALDVIPAGAGLLTLWAIGFEIERWVAQLRGAGALRDWPDGQILMLWLSLLAATGGLMMALAGRAARIEPVRCVGVLLLFGGTASWLTTGTLLPRVIEGVARAIPFLNPVFATGAIIAAGLVVFVRASNGRIHHSGAEGTEKLADGWRDATPRPG